jgi:hypothetical protein
MRLTLRTMLAYLDDILEPQDAQGLEQKIDESKFASDLVHRIRSSMRRLRLGAPKIDGKGMADDANTVAEYLDNSPTMTPDKVLEFEKVCLESDVHLAEVASAHQILTHVLREPALFEPAIRDRIYRLGHPDAVAAAAASSGSKSEPPVAREPVELAHATTASRPVAVSDDRAALAHVPLALGRQQKSSLPIASLAMTLLLGFVLAVVALRAMGELNSDHPVLRLLVGSRTPNQVAQVPSTETSSNTKVPTDSATKKEPAEITTDSTETKKSETPTEPTTAVDKSTRPADAPQETVTPAPETPTTKPTETIVDSKVVATDAASAVATTKQENAIVVPAKPDTGATATVAPAAPTKPSRPIESTTAPTVEPTPPAPVNAGVYLSEEQVLAHWDESAKAWLILPVNAPLQAGEELLSLPTFRPQVLVSPSVKITLAGEAYLKLHVPAAMNLPRITIDSGRATLIPFGDMGSSILVDVGGRTGVLTFDDVESAAAIDVRLYLPRGADPLMAAPHLVVQLWATSGSIDWQEQGKPAVHVAAGQMAAFLDEAEMKVAEKPTLPDWIDGKNLTEIDRRASQELRKFLTADRPLSLSLMEQTNYRQVEVRSLACRSLCHLDIYEPALESLGDEQQKYYWQAQIDALRARLPQGTEPAAKLKGTVEKLFNENGELVFRMLQGYSPEQLAAGGAKELVDELSNASMAVRALALENLKQITGKTLNFRPEYRPDLEKPKVTRWRTLLEEGQITYKEPAPAAP